MARFQARVKAAPGEDRGGKISEPTDCPPRMGAQLGACALASLGERDRAKEWANRALAIDPDDNNARYNVASVYSLLGEADRAFDLLELGRSTSENDSDFAPIRSHPRHANLLKLIE